MPISNLPTHATTEHLIHPLASIPSRYTYKPRNASISPPSSLSVYACVVMQLHVSSGSIGVRMRMQMQMQMRGCRCG